MPPPLSAIFTEHVSLHGESLCKNMARASGGYKSYALTDVQIVLIVLVYLKILENCGEKLYFEDNFFSTK